MTNAELRFELSKSACMERCAGECSRLRGQFQEGKLGKARVGSGEARVKKPQRHEGHEEEAAVRDHPSLTLPVEGEGTGKRKIGARGGENWKMLLQELGLDGDVAVVF
jgi:hypothetical protein